MTLLGERDTVRAAATFHGISPETLWGVYGTETSFGTNIAVSSAGAVGPFQFMPATAKMYKIDPMDFKQAAFGAAHYLSDSGADRDPESTKTAAALNTYSGGGGAEYRKKVLENGKTLSKNPLKDVDLGSVTDPITAPIKAADDIGSAIGSGIKWLTDPSSWLRVGKGALGFTLIVIGTGAAVLIVAKPIAKTAIGVTGTGKAVKRAVKSAAPTS
jgi:hypothetical protein